MPIIPITNNHQLSPIGVMPYSSWIPVISRKITVACKKLIICSRTMGASRVSRGILRAKRPRYLISS